MTWGERAERTILHIDGDGFFAACEQALNPAYFGKPIVTGAERGIAAAMSYEAKRRGVTRGMSVSEIKKVCPEVIFVPSDYETYSLFSRRMFNIFRRYTETVEEYGIDEGFLDITGMRSSLHLGYPEIAKQIQQTVQKELGITVSVGLSATKALAKTGSKWNKPNGFTIIPVSTRLEYLSQLPAVKIWGIGINTAAHLEHFGVRTAGQFAVQTEEWVTRNFSKPIVELWQELNGVSVWSVNSEIPVPSVSVSKTKTFTPSLTDQDNIFAELMKNIENACIKLRRHGLSGKKFAIFAKHADFTMRGMEGDLIRASNLPADFVPAAKELFGKLYQTGKWYRATGFVVSGLTEETTFQSSLFEPPNRLEKWKQAYQAVDAMSAKFGKHTIHLAGSEASHQRAPRFGAVAGRRFAGVSGETKRRHLGLPLLASVK